MIRRTHLTSFSFVCLAVLVALAPKLPASEIDTRPLDVQVEETFTQLEWPDEMLGLDEGKVVGVRPRQSLRCPVAKSLSRTCGQGGDSWDASFVLIDIGAWKAAPRVGKIIRYWWPFRLSPDNVTLTLRAGEFKI